MKKILLLLALSVCFLSKAQLPFPIGNTQVHQYGAGKYLDTKLIGDSTSFETQQNHFSFNKPIKQGKDTVSSKSYVRGLVSKNYLYVSKKEGSLYTEIQTAIDALPSTGGTVYVDIVDTANRYNSFTINKDNVSVIGISPTEYNPSTNMLLGRGALVTGGSTCYGSNCKIENLTFKNNYSGTPVGAFGTGSSVETIPITNFQAINCRFVGYSITAASHGLLVENVDGAVINNCKAYRAYHNFAIRSQNVSCNNLYSWDAHASGLIIKAGLLTTVRQTLKNIQINNLTVGFTNPTANGTGLIIQTKDASTSLKNINISNIYIKNAPLYGVDINSEYASPEKINISNIQIDSAKYYGIRVTQCSGLNISNFSINNTPTAFISLMATNQSIGLNLSNGLVNACNSSIYLKKTDYFNISNIKCVGKSSSTGINIDSCNYGSITNCDVKSYSVGVYNNFPTGKISLINNSITSNTTNLSGVFTPIIDPLTSSITTSASTLGATSVTNADGTLFRSTQSITTTPTDGLYCFQNTDATSGIPSRYSPSMSFLGRAWNTTAVASKSNAMQIYLRPVNGSTTTPLLVIANKTVDGVTNTTDLVTLNSSGVLNVTGSVTTPSVSCSPTISSGIAAPSTTPAKVGNVYVDTTNKKIYFSTGTASSADWTIVN